MTTSPTRRGVLAATAALGAVGPAFAETGATHFVHLDRPERGRDRLLAELASHFEGTTA